MHIEDSMRLDFKDVLIRPKRSTLTSRSEVDITREFRFLHSPEPYHAIPIVAANMDTTGTFEMARALAKHQISTALNKHYTAEELERFFTQDSLNAPIFYTLGIGSDEFDQLVRLQEKTDKAIRYLCLDVANGYTEAFVAFVSKVREAFPFAVIMAGNVVTGDMTEELILAGADIVKVGIGPGSVCTTRKMTGVGYPQLSAIIECADAAHGLGGRICADGGCTTPGDIAKAFGAGADFVMLGGLLAGHEESGGETIELNGKTFKRFYGMSSKRAMDQYAGGVAFYRAAEGKEVLIESRGSVETTVQDILGGIRSACTYVGARQLRELTKRTTFIRVSQQLNEVFGKS